MGAAGAAADIAVEANQAAGSNTHRHLLAIAIQH
jgi:hypothetical protein